MSELHLHQNLVLGVFVAAVLSCITLLYVTAPYGRHLRSGWGPTFSARTGWVVMESPAVLLFLAVYLQGQNRLQLPVLVFLAMWQLHYINRTFLFPFRLSHNSHRMPVAVAIMAIIFNCVNAYINARWISHFGAYDAAWLQRPEFIVGLTVFVAGWLINLHADRILIRLRSNDERGYRIPEGGLYRFVSCPNYFGEMLEWAGWALATWSMAGLAFAVFTVANLLPRAIANHRWYHQHFADYPESRKAVIPFLL